LSDGYSPAPNPAHRLIPSRFPPIEAFDTVALADDLQAVKALEDWTNDRLVADRLARLPHNEWVYGQRNSSVVMAAFLHVAPGGSRFNSTDLGAWYAAAALRTAVVEVAHHLRRELVARKKASERRTYREYTSILLGSYLDIRGQQATREELYDPSNYAAAQVFGESVRASGGAGIIYDSVRHTDGVAIVSHRPRNITKVTQAGHFEIHVQAATSRVEVRRLKT
jgi:hypothetical protein